MRIDTNLDQRWYVLRSKSRKEEVLAQHVAGLGFEVFYPQIPTQPVNPRARKSAPYFPGYLFVHVAIAQVGVSIFQWMPHAVGLVCFDSIPSDVPDVLITELQSCIHELTHTQRAAVRQLQKGDRITIRSGAFAGYEALFDTRLSGNNRVRVLLELLGNRMIPIELQVEQIAYRGQ
jgi:transcriptional antiterminator RfaH